ncbi:hypothetical protein ACQ33O_04580 [Ferruginibacter sp. SUN002]|uniref:hypothetical protein n=1 Tax=Ferruginibacter sp. SUN002 TaxID=2937789 RepID=UPI003D367FE3
MKNSLWYSRAGIFFVLSIFVFVGACKTAAETKGSKIEKTLVQKKWKLDQLRNVINGKYGCYIRDSINTTGVDYDKLEYTFNADGTGKYVDEVGKSHAVKWNFISSDKQTLVFAIEGNRPDIWETIVIKGEYLYATENFPVNGNPNNMHSFRLKQVP